MKRRVIIAVGASLLLLATGLGFFASRRTAVRIALIQVLNENGEPVEGAQLTPAGLKPKKSGNHYAWNNSLARAGVKAEAVRTDAEGYARVRYPGYVHEELETSHISFALDHPDYVPEHPVRLVDPSPPAKAPLKEKLGYVAERLTGRIRARPDPVVLKRGGIVRITGYVGAPDNVVTNLAVDMPLLMATSSSWPRADGQTWVTRVRPGPGRLRVIHFPEAGLIGDLFQGPRSGAVMFSDLVSFEVKPGETTVLALELKPGVRVVGRVDASVPRPLGGGRVCIRVYGDGLDGRNKAPVWRAWEPLAADGSFTFESLPAGRMDIIGLCDGFVSSNDVSRLNRTWPERVVPQTFAIRGRQQEIELRMESAAACAVAVLDDAGRPLEGATVSFSPIVRWGGGNGISPLFAGDVLNSEDLFRHGITPQRDAPHRKAEDYFRATTDHNGMALVRNLPAGVQIFSVSHARYEMPIDHSRPGGLRSGSVQVSAGETNRVAVKMQQRGSTANERGRGKALSPAFGMP